MKKLLSFLLLIVLISCGGTTHPPVSPQPPIPPTSTPIVSEEEIEVPMPTGECVRTLAQKTRWLTYGHYGAFNADDPSGLVDYDYLAALICQNKPWTGASFHLLGPWEKTPNATPVQGDWPFKWMADKKQFNGTKIDPLWFSNRLDRALDAFGKRGLDLELALLDQYCCGSGTPQTWHPWRQNNAGEIFTSTDALYSSLALFDRPVRFHHIAWTDVNEARLQFNFSTPTPMAKMMNLYFETVTDHIVAAMNRWPNLRVGWKLANESLGGDKKVGDRSEMYADVTQMFKRKGLTVGNRFYAFLDREYETRYAESGKTLEQTLIDRRKELHDSVVKPYGMSWGLGAVLELHKRCRETEVAGTEGYISVQYRIRTGGAKEADTLFSNDGNTCKNYYPNTNGMKLDDALKIAAATPSEVKKIIKAGHKFTDIKMEEAWTPWPQYRQGDVNRMLRRYTLLHLKLAS